jgi:signal transduction histidine kinase
VLTGEGDIGHIFSGRQLVLLCAEFTRKAEAAAHPAKWVSVACARRSAPADWRFYTADRILSHMMKLFQALGQWYRDLVARSLAELPREQREDIFAFDSALRRNKWPVTFVATGVWLVAAVAFRVTIRNTSWTEAFLLTMFLLVTTGFALMSVWFGHRKFKISLRSFGLVFLLACAGALFGAMIARWMKLGSLEAVFADFGSFGSRTLFAGLIAGAVYGGLLLLVLLVRRRTLQKRNEELQRQTEQERTARQLADARLKLMQAQVEPHFLFNTLASVQQLAEGKAPKAAELTRELIAFLRAGLAGLRDDTTTLEREFAMAAAFLAIMKTRMGDRLSYQLELPEALRSRAIPPAMLISLVENAIKHGLEPSTSGGALWIGAREMPNEDSTTLVMEVRDTGLGLGAGGSSTVGGGVGLANVRERLEAIYGERARLQIEENSPQGVVAMIEITEGKPVEVGTEPIADSYGSVM